MSIDLKGRTKDTRPYWKVAASLSVSLFGTALFLIIGYKALIYFLPFVLGWVISSLASPLVFFLEEKVRIVRKLGSALIIVAVLAGIVMICYFIIGNLWREVESLLFNMPAIYKELEAGLREAVLRMQRILQMLPKGVRMSEGATFGKLDGWIGDVIGTIGMPTVDAAGRLAKGIPSALVGTIVAFISAYFFIADREQVLLMAGKVVPAPVATRMALVSDNLKFAVGGYFKAQFKIMIVVFGILAAGFSLMRLRFTFLLAIIIAFLDFLPFFGTGTALLPWAVYKLLVADCKMAAGLFVLYGVSQLVRQLIQPKLVGDSIGMNPLLTLFFLYIGYRTGGVFGMIFAVPAGLIAINLYKAGVFDYILDDAKVLLDGILSLWKKS